jgi:predicted CopG family antitoxin
MVKVITIKDEIYDELKRLKDAKDMSFSEVISYLLRVERERMGRRVELSSLKGSLTRDEIRKKLLKRLRTKRR